MSDILEEMRNEAARKAVDRDRVAIALNLLADGVPTEKVAQYTQLPVERVQGLKDMKAAS